MQGSGWRNPADRGSAALHADQCPAGLL